MSEYMADISSLIKATDATAAKHSASRKGSNELNMEDFLQLMIVQLTSQTIDDTMDTSEMMNQMVQMQMITAVNSLTEASVMSYASSLVGKVVTVGIVNDNTLEEREIVVMGTGTYDGKQVIFGSDGEMYQLSQIMAVGYLPDENGKYTVPVGGESNNNAAEGTEGAGGTTEKPTEGSGEATENPNPAEGGEVTPPTGTEGAGESQNPEYNGEDGAPTD